MDGGGDAPIIVRRYDAAEERDMNEPSKAASKAYDKTWLDNADVEGKNVPKN